MYCNWMCLYLGILPFMALGVVYILLFSNAVRPSCWIFGQINNSATNINGCMCRTYFSLGGSINTSSLTKKKQKKKILTEKNESVSLTVFYIVWMPAYLNIPTYLKWCIYFHTIWILIDLHRRRLTKIPAQRRNFMIFTSIYLCNKHVETQNRMDDISIALYIR